MSLYFGSNKVKINLNGVEYYLNLFSEVPITNGIRLLSSDGYILKDSNGLYLTVKANSNNNVLLSSDDCILTDSTGQFLIFKESE